MSDHPEAERIHGDTVLLVDIDWTDLSVILWTEECDEDEALVRLSPRLARKAAAMLEKLAGELEEYTREIKP